MTVFIQCQIHKIVIFRSVNKRKHIIGRELRKSVSSVVLGLMGAVGIRFCREGGKTILKVSFVSVVIFY